MTAQQTTVAQPLEQSTDHTPHNVQITDCCIVGAGPAGAVLALLLARKGVGVTLLEGHHDFDREFRGDTIHPSVMEVMDELGLADRLLTLRHTKLRRINLQTASGPLLVAPFERLRTRFRYITLMPQTEFLKFITTEAQRYPAFKLVMGARVEELIKQGGVVRGVRYGSHDGWHDVRARLVVGADGRFSRIRKLAGIEPIKTSPPMDVLWFKLPRVPSDPEEVQGRVRNGRFIAMLNRVDHWQCAYIIPKDSYATLHAAGLPAFRQTLAELAPLIADRVDHLETWKQLSLLSVESSRCPRWYKPGLLLIGDAAHVMSPVGGVGINYAIMDAVATANILGKPLREGGLTTRDLRAVQQRREWPTRVIQAIQAFLQRRVVAGALNTDSSLNIPPLVRRLLRSSLVLKIPARLIAYGVLPEHVKAEPNR
jgi:2-polyprenyl-6-methoxyphenol hydroxylase-like FAD-dependent oxidoreductase